MAPECAPVLLDRNKIPSVELDKQYWMLHTICDLYSGMIYRNGRTKISMRTYGYMKVTSTNSLTSFLCEGE